MADIAPNTPSAPTCFTRFDALVAHVSQGRLLLEDTPLARPLTAGEIAQVNSNPSISAEPGSFVDLILYNSINYCTQGGATGCAVGSGPYWSLYLTTTQPCKTGVTYSWSYVGSYYNDETSSFKVGSYCNKTTLYANANLTGTSQLYTGDTSNVGSTMNDKTSSVKTTK